MVGSNGDAFRTEDCADYVEELCDKFCSVVRRYLLRDTVRKSAYIEKARRNEGCCRIVHGDGSSKFLVSVRDDKYESFAVFVRGSGPSISIATNWNGPFAGNRWMWCWFFLNAPPALAQDWQLSTVSKRRWP